LRRPWTCCSAGSDPLPHYRPHPLTPSPPPLPYSGPRPPRPPRPPTTPSLTPSRTRLSTLSPSQAVPSCVRPETCPHPQPCTGPSPFLLPISHWPQKTMPPACLTRAPALSSTQKIPLCFVFWAVSNMTCAAEASGGNLVRHPPSFVLCACRLRMYRPHPPPIHSIHCLLACPARDE